MLVAFGADLRIKDANGRRVCDVTTDRAWKREIVASIVEIERSQAACEGARNRDALFRHQSNLREERLRRSVTAQRDEERQRALESTNTSTSNASAAPEKNKNKKKNKTGKKGKTTANTSASSSAVPDCDSAEVSTLLKDLLVSPDSEIDTNDDSERVSESTMENTTAMFNRLRDTNISGDDKANDVERACKLIKKLEGSVESFSHPSRLNSTDRRIRIGIASEALQVIHMMQKFHRVNHPAIAVPALASVRKLCDTTLEFTKPVVGTAQLFAAVDRKSQPREILDVLEKRLVKMPFDKRDPTVYRELVQTYSSARDTMRLGKTSNPDTFRSLEWYLSNIADRFNVQVALDKIVGRSMYVEFTTAGDITELQFRRFQDVVETKAELDGVACFGNRVVYGATTFDDLMRVLREILDLAKRERMLFAVEGTKIAQKSLYVGQFKFSEGVVRNDSAVA